MAVTLYQMTVPTFQQYLGSVAALINKAEAWCEHEGHPPEELIEARLAPDMLPFSYQIKSSAVHSLKAIEGVRRGVFSPDRSPPPQDFAALKTLVAETLASLAELDPEEINGLYGKDLRFEIGDRVIPFTAEDFLRAFSLPNFFFHVTTAYDILRMKGLDIGKRDYLNWTAPRK